MTRFLKLSRYDQQPIDVWVNLDQVTHFEAYQEKEGTRLHLPIDGKSVVVKEAPAVIAHELTKQR